MKILPCVPRGYLYRRRGAGADGKIDLYQTLHGDHGHPQHRQRVPPGAGRDELPQSGSGRTIMTAEPKFVPEEAVQVTMDNGAAFSVRLIDCVGYMVPGAVGSLEDDSPAW